ncbi:MAG: sulfotransferase [Cyanobacteria bacterium P01_F01_bin.143]
MVLNFNIFSYYTPKRIQSFLKPLQVARNLVWRYGARISYSPHVFVIGAPRSGTTLLFSILAAHPSFAAINNETYFFTFRDVFKLENYSRLSDFGGPSKKEFGELLSNSQDLVDFYDNVAKFMIERDGGSRFLEKSPIHTIYLGYLIKKFPNAKFINLIRDGRDCYVSYSRLPYCESIEKYAKRWRDSIRVRQKQGKNTQIIDVRYEDLVNQPEAITHKIMDFIGEKFYAHQVTTQGYSNPRIFNEHSGHERLNKPIKANTVGKWREQLNPRQIDSFNKIAKKELKSLEYDI